MKTDRLIKAVREFTKTSTQNSEVARLTLFEMGIYTIDGKLTPEYSRADS
jgi:hypothetical protein